MHFDTDDPATLALLDCVTEYPHDKPGRIGRRWAENICRIAWEIYRPLHAARERDLRAARRKNTRS